MMLQRGVNLASRRCLTSSMSAGLKTNRAILTQIRQNSTDLNKSTTAQPQFNTPNPKPIVVQPVVTPPPPTTATTTTPPVNNSAAPPPLPPPSSPVPPSPPSPKKKKRGFFGRTKLVLGYGTLAFLIASGYFIYDANHPPIEQLPFDETKKTLVILGSGWGATALLDGIDTTDYNVVVISPVNYFLFTPLLPSVTVGTLNGRSITQPTRHIVRYKNREVQLLEAEATKVDPKQKLITFEDKSDMYGSMGTVQIPYDYLVYAVGSQNQTFGIEGVKKHGLFLKELGDAESIRRRLMDCVEKASLLGQSEEEIDRLLHFVVVGGGPTGVEASSEFRDFVRDDLSKWYNKVSGRVKVTLIEALPNILPSFSKNLVEFTEHVFKENEIQILTKHIVKDVDEKSVTVQDPNGKIINIPMGMLVWAAGNTARPITRDLQEQLKEDQNNRRGLLVDECLRLKGAEDSIFAIGDATATNAPPTAQVANQQGRYLAGIFESLARIERVEKKLNKYKQIPEQNRTEEEQSEIKRLERKLERTQSTLKPFHYTNRGAMAYIGTEQAILDLPYGSVQLSSGGFLTGLAWSSAYWSMLFGIRCRTSVALDWLHVRVFGRSIEALR